MNTLSNYKNFLRDNVHEWEEGKKFLVMSSHSDLGYYFVKSQSSVPTKLTCSEWAKLRDDKLNEERDELFKRISAWGSNSKYAYFEKDFILFSPLRPDCTYITKDEWECYVTLKPDVTDDAPDNKYAREIIGLDGTKTTVDVYRVLDAFPTTNPQLQHLIKKALATGQRGHKDELEDLLDIQVSINSAIAMYRQKNDR